MDIFKAFATDEQRELTGAEFAVPGGNATITVARSSNPKYTKAIVATFKTFEKAPDGPDKERQMEEAFNRLLARHILLGCTNVEYRGAPFEYNQANAETLLKIKDFRDFVTKCAADFDAFRVEVEEEAGNA